jgi:leucyl aminopeptidase
VEDGELRGKPGDSALFHAREGVASPRVAAVGVGTDGAIEGWRSAGEAAARRARQVSARSLALAAGEGASRPEITAFVDGLGAGAYRFDRFKTSDDDRRPGPERLAVHAPSGVTGADLRRADRLVDALDAARDLANTPANHLTPRLLGERALALADEVPGLSCQVLGPSRLERLGAGALLGVARGSDEPPRMIVLRYSPGGKRRRTGDLLGLVGKAVTFDTGGISIKPAAKMHEMKFDMSGGAAVIEAMGAIAQLGLAVKITAVVPSTENMPSGHAVKPGDIVTAMNGKTIEVNNTDAEGRLILADALCYVVDEGAERIVDLATLTGAIIVALGSTYAGLFSNDDDWYAQVEAASAATGEWGWRLPLHQEYFELTKGQYADLSNAAEQRKAMSSYAAEFLRQFVDDTPWVHVDIAGTAWNTGRPNFGNGATGFGTRMLVELAQRVADGGGGS